MLVPVLVDAAVNEWSVLEFQGECRPSGGEGALELQGVDIGTLRFGHAGALTLRIGTHVVTGKVQTLSQPFAILHKSDGRHAMDGTMGGSGEAAAAQVQYEVVGIARTRVVFASRPKPVLA